MPSDEEEMVVVDEDEGDEGGGEPSTVSDGDGDGDTFGLTCTVMVRGLGGASACLVCGTSLSKKTIHELTAQAWTKLIPVKIGLFIISATVPIKNETGIM